MATTLAHVRLPADDYAACFRFYRDGMGFEATLGDEESGYADSTPARRPSRCSTAGRSPGRSGRPTCRALSDAGVEFVTKPTDRPERGIRVAYLRDPDGTLLELNEPME